MARRWLITGCSRGLGRALAEAAAQAGEQVAVTARGTASLAPLVEAYPGNVVPLALDVRDAAQCAEVVAAAHDRLGGIDVLVNNAGIGLFGAVEETGDAELRDQFETLVFGPWRLVRLVLPHMRAQHGGHIVNVSSSGARSMMPGLAAYLSAKQALESMSQALVTEVAPFGIRVTVVEPGPYATDYGKAMTETTAKLDAYGAVAPFIDLFRGLAENPIAGRPEDYARALLRILDTPAPTPLRIPLGSGAAEMADAALHAARDEFEAAQALAAAATAPDDPDPAATAAADTASDTLQSADTLAAANGSAP